MAYTDFQYVAYEVPTVSRANGSAGGFPRGESDGPLEMPNDMVDAETRLRRLVSVVGLAASRAHGSPNTLKVFMAPEFYFRPENTDSKIFPHATYPQEHAFSIFEKME